MNYSKHCDLCENRKTSLKNGLTCKLTNRKPEFEKTCSKIMLREKFQEKLELINLELKNIKKRKPSIHLNFYVFITIGFLLIIGGVYLINSTQESIYSLKLTFLIIGSGITFLGIAYNKLNKYRKRLRNAENDKLEIDELLKQYEIEYRTNFDFKKNIHGIQELIIELEFINWVKKRTTTPYKIYA